MKNSIIVIALSIICIILMIEFPHLMLNPGELVKGHQKLNQDCFACHTAFSGVENKKCISCHKLDEIDKNNKKEKIPFHQFLKNQDCLVCHSDHKGIIPEHSINYFEHNLLNSSIINKCINCHIKPIDTLHQLLSNDCGNCHNIKTWKFSTKFEHKLVKNTDINNCTLCHKAPNDGLHNSVKDNCSKCHNTEKWKPANYDHYKYFRLDNDHNVKCNICHTNSNNFKIYTCYGCHDHTEANIRNEHLEEGIKNFTNCVSCHKGSKEGENEFEGRKQNNNSNEEGEDD